MPEDMAVQIPYIHRAVEAFNLSTLELSGYEADDIIGTLAVYGEERGMEVVIVSGDKDLLQLVTDSTVMLDEMKGITYDREKAKAKFGVPVEQIIEAMALMGDSSDNIPGVPKIGPKTAQALIERFGDLDNLYERLDEIKSAAQRTRLEENRALAFLSRKLVTINKRVPMEFDLESFKIQAPDEEVLTDLLQELEFRSLLKTFLPEAHKAETEKDYRPVMTHETLEKLIGQLKDAEAFALDLETTSLDTARAEIVGISFSFQEGIGYYIPLAHTQGPEAQQQLDRETALAELTPLLEDPRYKKIGQNIKYDLMVFSRAGIRLAGISFDTMIASYLLNPERSSHSLDNLALSYLNYRMLSYKEVTGAGAKQIGFDQVDIPTAVRYAAEDAEITYSLFRILFPKIKEAGYEELFYDLELPLLEVLARMQINGIRVDREILKNLSGKFQEKLEALGKRITLLAGVEFNPDSTRQLAEVLFERLKLPVRKKTKTGYSTDVEVLEALAGLHPLPAEMLVYRQLKKLKSTYTDALAEQISDDQRIHCSFNQTVTATGRLSCSDPNLQNIPIRTAEGRSIRKAFIPRSSQYCLLGADYSQIELRILAHFSEDERLISAFLGGEDIHSRTAAEVFGVPIEAVQREMRRKAKIINFGVLYGMGAFSLAKDLKVTNKAAQEFISLYFERLPQVRIFLDNTIAEAASKGYVSTLSGRKRPIPELRSRNKNIVRMGERMAVNTPIQGTSADLIKKAMLNIDQRLREKGWSDRLLLQIHDELIFETPISEVNELSSMVKHEMEHVAALKVPLVVNVKTGSCWEEL
ncbi:MAG: DNA polymerase I [bacterium]